MLRSRKAGKVLAFLFSGYFFKNRPKTERQPCGTGAQAPGCWLAVPGLAWVLALSRSHRKGRFNKRCS